MKEHAESADTEAVEERPKKRRLRKFLKVAGISFGLLLVALFVVYYICLLVITSEMEEDIQKWRNNPDNILNVRINKTPIRYEVDPEIAKDLEKFYIGEFEILLPDAGIDQPFVSCFYRNLDKDRPICEVHPIYKKFGITVFRSYRSFGRTAKLSEFEEDYPAVFWEPAWSGYSEAPFHLQATYKVTRFLCDISLQSDVETLENIMSYAPEDIENCNTPWATFDLASRLSLKDMFVFSGMAADERDVKAYKIQRCLSDRWTGIVNGISRAGQKKIYRLEINDEFLTLVFWRCEAGGEDSNNSIVTTLELEKTILASFKRHDEKEAGQIMYKKSE